MIPTAPDRSVHLALNPVAAPPPRLSLGAGRGWAGGLLLTTVAGRGAASGRQTVLWVGHARADEDGVARFEFDASDLVTSFVALVDGAAPGGALGAARREVVSTRQPLVVEAKLPAEV